MIQLNVKHPNIGKELAKKLKDLKTREVAVGVLKSTNKDYGEGETIAEIGYVHEYGNRSKGIPQRSFLRMPFYKHQKQVDRMVEIGYKSLVEGTSNVNDALNKIGGKATSIVVDAFNTRGYGEWQDNSEKTIALKTINGKQGTEPLVDTGNLKQSIHWEVRGIQK